MNGKTDSPGNLRIVEYTPDRAPDALRIRNAIFPPISMEDWLETKTMTGVLAYLDDEVVGCIPMDQREFLVAAGTTIRVVFENAVGTREDMRSKGIGTAMIQGAREFLAERIDALMVYRGAERSRGYKFYVRSGHHDLLYCRLCRRRNPQGEYGRVALGDEQDMARDAEAVHEAFAATWGETAGFPPRSPGYQARQLKHQIYKVLPQETLYFRLPETGPLEAYAICGIRTGSRADGTLAVLEIATRTGEGIPELFAAIGAEAAARGLDVTRHTEQDDPFRLIMRRIGFEEPVRHFMILGQVLRPSALFCKTCTDLGLFDHLRIDVWTPTYDATLYEGPAAREQITVEGKDDLITRLLMRRLDVRAAVEHGLLTIRNGTPDVVHRLHSGFPPARWVYHHLDYI